VIAAGKAAARMFGAAAAMVEIETAVVATAEPVALVTRGVDVFNAGHPAPNDASQAAGDRALELAGRSARDRGLLVLLSGGASAMLAAPVSGVTLQDKMRTAKLLMEAGAAIHELNCVRKHLSRIKGGRLAAAAGRTITFALSDVHGPIADDPAVIASGPTVPDHTTFKDALEVIARRGIRPPDSVRSYLERGARGEVDETIKRDDPRLRQYDYTVIGNRHTAAAGAARAAEQRGYTVVSLTDATSGEAREAALAFVRTALQRCGHASGRLCVLASGETTVTVRGRGLGGRNQEFALAVAAELENAGRAAVLASAGTDGIDGPTDAAGAIVDPTTLARARAMGVDAERALADNDSYHFFEPLGDLIQCGPTGTNVGDLHVLLCR
jgi:glycerate 2-kinase